MKKRKCYFFLWLICGVSMNTTAEVIVPDFRHLTWNERTYKTKLPKSFGEVAVNVRSQGDGKVESILIDIVGETILVPLEQLIGVEHLGAPDLAIENEGGERESLRILFEYGAPVRVQVDSSSDWLRPVLTISINHKGKFEVIKNTPGL